jgi:hypothetical protein
MALLEDLTRNALPPDVIANVESIIPLASPPPSLLQLIERKKSTDWGRDQLYWYQQDCYARIFASHIVTQLLTRSAHHA